jgi:hypothetical protein
MLLTDSSCQLCNAGVILLQVQVRKLRLRERKRHARAGREPLLPALPAVPFSPPETFKRMVARKLGSEPDQSWPSDLIPQHPPGSRSQPISVALKSAGRPGCVIAHINQAAPIWNTFKQTADGSEVPGSLLIAFHFGGRCAVTCLPSRSPARTAPGLRSLGPASQDE